MGLFKNDKKGKPPHTWYPDILHWQEGDQIFCWNVAKAIGYLKAKSSDWAKYTTGDGLQSGYMSATFKYKSVDQNGNIYLEDKDDHLVQFEFYRFIKAAKNESLESRELESHQQDSEEYMELMEEFQKAFNELQESDNHPHRLEEPEEPQRQSANQNSRERRKSSGS
jgi:hypothetical protein